MSNGGIQIPVGVKMTGNEVSDVADKIEDRLKKLVESVNAGNKVKYDPFDPKTLQTLDAIAAKLAAIAKLHQGLAHAGGIPLLPGGLHTTPAVGVPAQVVQVPAIAPAPPAPGAPGHGHGGGGNQYRTHGWSRTMWGQPLHAGLNAVGPAGSVVAGAISRGQYVAGQSGASAGIGAGLAGLAGGMLALGIGKVIGSARAKIGSAEQEYIGYDTLKRTLGDVNVGFNVLKETLRDTSRGLDMTFAEGLKLGQDFVKLSGMSGDQYKTLGGELQNAGGFSRSFGLDASQGGRFFAQMRNFHVTSNVEDSRRLGLVIGETIARSGAFSKADEVLDAIAGYTSQQTRQGLTAANVAGYGGMYANLVHSGIPGMDAGGAAALLGRMNGSFAAGGGAGEAGENFIYRALGSRLGLDPIQATILREQGLFGTGAKTFGKDGIYGQFADAFHLGTPGGGAGSTATNLQLVMEQFEKNYGGDPELMVNGMSRLFGVNNSQAMGFATAYKKYGAGNVGGLAERLGKIGVNVNDVSGDGISNLAQLYTNGASDDELKKAAASHQEETDGSKTRATINGVENAITTLASSAIPLLNDMRTGILYMAGAKDKVSTREMAEVVMTAQSRDRASGINQHFDALEKNADTVVDMRRAAREKAEDLFTRNSELGKYSPKQKEAERAKLVKLRDEENDAIKRAGDLHNERVKKLNEESAALEKNIQALRLSEEGAGAGRGQINDTGYRPETSSSAGPGSGSVAWRNNNPGNIKWSDEKTAAWLGATGKDASGYAVFPSEAAGRSAEEKLLFEGKNYKNLSLSKAIQRWAPDGQNNGNYIASLLGAVGGQDKRMSEYTAAERSAILDAQQKFEGWKPGADHSTPLPDQAEQKRMLAQEDFRRQEHVVTFYHSNGQPAAAPITIATRTGTPSGAH